MTQLSLFERPDVYTQLGVQADRLIDWHELGFLSFDPRHIKRWERWMLLEAVFIRDLFRTESSINAIRKMLAELDRPYAYRHSERFYDFAEQCWRSRFEAPLVAQALARSPEAAAQLACGLIETLRWSGQSEQLEHVRQALNADRAK